MTPAPGCPQHPAHSNWLLESKQGDEKNPSVGCESAEAPSRCQPQTCARPLQHPGFTPWRCSRNARVLLFPVPCRTNEIPGVPDT